MPQSAESVAAMGAHAAVLTGFGEEVEIRSIDPKVCGGGRGLFATRDIPVGAVVAVEEPFLLVPDEREAQETLHTALAREALRAMEGEGGDLVRTRLAALHPQSLDDLDADTVARQREACAETVAKLRDASGGLLSSDGDALRLILACQFNGFRSGMYCRLAMINHRCKPNCVKFAGVGGGPASEIVAVREIAPGEEVTISYLSPVEQSHARRDATFREQHLFPVGPSPFDAAVDTPPNPRLEDLLDELESAPASAGERLKRALEVEAMCRAEAPCGFVEARVCKEVNRAVFQALEERRGGGVGGVGGDDDVGLPEATIVLQLVRSTRSLIALQRRYLWPQHHELGTTLIDHHNALEHAIANHAPALYAGFPEDLGSFRLASRADFKARKEGEAIRKLYDAGRGAKP